MPSSFYAEGATIYEDTNGSVADAPMVNTPTPAPSSFYKETGGVLTSLAEANFTLGISVPGGTIAASEWLFGFTFDFEGTFPTNLVGSQAVARIGASSPTALSLLCNGVQFGTLTFTRTQGSFVSTQQTFNVGDVLEIIGAASPDVTLSHLTISLLGARD